MSTPARPKPSARPGRLITGSPKTVRGGIETLADEYDADEVLLVNIMYDHVARRRSYELVAREFALTRIPRQRRSRAQGKATSHGLSQPRQIRPESLPSLPRLHDLRRPARGAHPWSLDEEQSRPFIRRALELASTSSIPPTSTPTAPSRNSSAAPSRTWQTRGTRHRPKVHGRMRPDATAADFHVRRS